MKQATTALKTITGSSLFLLSMCSLSMVATGVHAEAIHKCEGEYTNKECEQESERARVHLPKVSTYDSDEIFENAGVDESKMLERVNRTKKADEALSANLDNEGVRARKNVAKTTADAGRDVTQLIEQAESYYEEMSNGFTDTPRRTEAMKLQVELSTKCNTITSEDSITLKERCQKAIHNLKEVVHQ